MLRWFLLGERFEISWRCAGRDDVTQSTFKNLENVCMISARKTEKLWPASCKAEEL